MGSSWLSHGSQLQWSTSPSTALPQLQWSTSPSTALPLRAESRVGGRSMCLMCWSHRGQREMFYLTTHSTHFIYGYMASDIWLRTILIVREETRCRHIGYYYRLTARITHTTAFVTPVVEHWLEREIAQWVHPMKDRSDDPSHHERTWSHRTHGPP